MSRNFMDGYTPEGMVSFADTERGELASSPSAPHRNPPDKDRGFNRAAIGGTRDIIHAVPFSGPGPVVFRSYGGRTVCGAVVTNIAFMPFEGDRPWACPVCAEGVLPPAAVKPPLTDDVVGILCWSCDSYDRPLRRSELNAFGGRIVCSDCLRSELTRGRITYSNGWGRFEQDLIRAELRARAVAEGRDECEDDECSAEAVAEYRGQALCLDCMENAHEAARDAALGI